jgi:hypothetical protein
MREVPDVASLHPGYALTPFRRRHFAAIRSAAYQSRIFQFQSRPRSGHRDHALLAAVPAIASKPRLFCHLPSSEKCVCSE